MDQHGHLHLLPARRALYPAQNGVWISGSIRWNEELQGSDDLLSVISPCHGLLMSSWTRNHGFRFQG